MQILDKNIPWQTPDHPVVRALIHTKVATVSLQLFKVAVLGNPPYSSPKLLKHV